MNILEIKNLSFSYPDQESLALSEINLSIKSGEIVYICGQTGAGKSTLLHCIKKEIRPIGNLNGELIFNGIAIDKCDVGQLIRDIGIVFQNPDSQTIMDTVMGEIAFGLENLGLPTSEIRQRISETAGYFGIEHLFKKSFKHISGGERQTVNLCAVLAMHPKLLLLDEPLSQLDPVAQNEFIGILK